MATNTSGLSPYMDTGTGAYEGPPSEVTVNAEHDPNPTGLVEGPPASVTVESPPEHLSEPTGASPNPPASVTNYQWPGEPPKEEPVIEQPQQADAKAVTEADAKAVTEADNKAVVKADIKTPTGARGAGKRGR